MTQDRSEMAERLNPEEVLGRLIAQVQDADNDAHGFVIATELSEALNKAVMQNAQLRRAYGRRLWKTWSLDEIADLIGKTRSRIEQIVK